MKPSYPDRANLFNSLPSCDPRSRFVCPPQLKSHKINLYLLSACHLGSRCPLGLFLWGTWLHELGSLDIAEEHTYGNAVAVTVPDTTAKSDASTQPGDEARRHSSVDVDARRNMSLLVCPVGPVGDVHHGRALINDVMVVRGCGVRQLVEDRL